MLSRVASPLLPLASMCSRVRPSVQRGRPIAALTQSRRLPGQSGGQHRQPFTTGDWPSAMQSVGAGTSFMS
jgi:hypothetical protein